MTMRPKDCTWRSHRCGQELPGYDPSMRLYKTKPKLIDSDLQGLTIQLTLVACEIFTTHSYGYYFASFFGGFAFPWNQRRRQDSRALKFKSGRNGQRVGVNRIHECEKNSPNVWKKIPPKKKHKSTNSTSSRG